MNAIAASVIGVVHCKRGIGTIPGVVLGCLFLRTVIDAVNKIVGTGSDVYEGMIVGIVVVMAVTFSQRANAAVRKVLFADAIGWSAIPVLAVLAGLVVRLVLSRERLVHDEPRSGVRVRRGCIAGRARHHRNPSVAERLRKRCTDRFIQSVGKSFGVVRALDGVSFDVQPGELHAIMGENGAGKSTLMKILSGVISDYDGAVLIRAIKLGFKDTRDAESRDQHHPPRAEFGGRVDSGSEHFLGRELHRLGVLQQHEMDRRAAELLGRCSAPFRQRHW